MSAVFYNTIDIGIGLLVTTKILTALITINPEN